MMQTLMGFPVVIDPLCDNVPCMQVSEKFAASFPALAVETNAWMREFFGTKSVMYVATDPMTQRKTIILGLRAMDKLRAEARYVTAPNLWGGF